MPRSTSLASVFCISIVAGACSQEHPLAPTPTGATPTMSLAESFEARSGGASQWIRITHGTIVSGPQRASASMRGTHGFRLDAVLQEGVSPGGNCPYHVTCVPGHPNPISLDGVWAGISVNGTARLQGRTYTFGSAEDRCGIVLRLFGSFLAPPQAGTATLTTHFSLDSGEPQLRAQFGFCGEVGTRTLEGSGIATVSLTWNTPTGSWSVAGVEFDFGRGR
jgi:hypothetical protein